MILRHLGIEIDYARDDLLPEQGKVLLTKEGYYKLKHETSPQQGFARAATAYCFGDYAFAQRIYDAASKGHFTFASPVLSNAPRIKWPDREKYTHMTFDDAAGWLAAAEGVEFETKGMPISCFLSFIDDTKEALTKTSEETRNISMAGGGIGIFPAMRSPDAKSTGVMAHMRGYDADALSYKQTESRRGSIATYMDINHPEILSFISMRDPMGGDPNLKCFNLNNGVNITDEFMHAYIDGKDYELIDPKHGPTGRMINAVEVWDKIMELRFKTGEPFIQFIDTVNRNIPAQVTKSNYYVRQSNLCSEITLMSSATRTAVCCLSSLNLDKYEEWKDTTLVADLVRLLDNVLEFFIRLAPKEFKRAIYSATKERAIGLGTLGWHSFLQSKMIPFESGGFNSSIQWTNVIYSRIKSQAEAESRQLAIERGEPDDCKGSGFRNSHLMAIAPNASSSQMVNVSPSIEPWAGNAFVSKGRAGLFLIKNKYLDEVLQQHKLNDDSIDLDEVWKSIVDAKGSCQHLEFLSDHERKVFKTAREIDQMWIIEQGSHRQGQICQSQSLNLFVRKDITKQEMSDLHFAAWTKDVKTLYYCRAESAVTAKVKEGNDKAPLNAVPVTTENKYNECLACEG